MVEGSGIGYHPQIIGGGDGFGLGGGGLGAFIIGAAIGGGGLFGRDRGHGDDNCANARFLALENGIAQTQDMIANQNVLGAISKAETTAAVRFDAIQNNINQNQTQALLASERTNGNIAEVKFQNALNFQALGKQLSDCCCELQMSGTANTQKILDKMCETTTQNLRDKLADEKLENSQLKQTGFLTLFGEKFNNFASKQSDINVALGNTVTNTSTLLNSIAGKIPGLTQS